MHDTVEQSIAELESTAPAAADTARTLGYLRRLMFGHVLMPQQGNTLADDVVATVGEAEARHVDLPARGVSADDVPASVCRFFWQEQRVLVNSRARTREQALAALVNGIG